MFQAVVLTRGKLRKSTYGSKPTDRTEPSNEPPSN